MDAPHVVIEWKVIIIELVAIFLMRELLLLYVIWEYKRILKRFGSGKWDGLQKKIRPLKRISNFFSGGRRNQYMRLIHDNYCVIWASISYCNGDEEDFVRWLNDTKSGDPKIGKECMLALYYRSKGMQEDAERFYRACQAGRQEKQMMILDYFFANKALPDDTTLESFCASFKNQAVHKLIQENMQLK